MAKCNEYNERGAIVKNKYLFYRKKLLLVKFPCDNFKLEN